MTDLAHALDADGPAAQAGAAPGVLGRRPHAVHDAERGQHRRIARAAVRGGPAGHVAAFPGDDVHVLAARADVTRGDVAAAERGDEAAVGAQQRLGLDPGGIADDDGLPAAVVQARQRVLVGHGRGQPQHVSEGVLLAAVRVEAGTAERGAQGGGVDADDRPEPGLWLSWQKTTCSWSAGPGRPFSLWGIANTLVTVATLLISSRLFVEPGSQPSVWPAPGPRAGSSGCPKRTPGSPIRSVLAGN